MTRDQKPNHLENQVSLGTGALVSGLLSYFFGNVASSIALKSDLVLSSHLSSPTIRNYTNNDYYAGLAATTAVVICTITAGALLYKYVSNSINYRQSKKLKTSIND